MAINNLLNIGRNAMGAYRGAIEIASNNAANSGVDGYSRRRGQLASLGLGQGRHVAAGVRLGDPQRVIDTLADSAARRSLGRQSSLANRETVLERIEGIVAPETGGLTERLEGFFSAWSRLSANPSGRAERGQVLASAQTLVDDLRFAREQLGAIASPLAEQAADQVAEINDLARDVAELNEAILGAEPGDVEASELRDERDRILDQLAGLTGAQSLELRDGSVTVALPGGEALVSGPKAATLNLDIQGNVVSLSATLPGGKAEKPVAAASVGGGLAGIVTALTRDVADAIDELDAFAFDFANIVNGIHRQGVGLDGVAGRDLFTVPAGRAGAASQLTLDAAVANDPTLLAATRDPGRLPGGSELALELADLRNAAAPEFGGRTAIDTVIDLQTGIGHELSRTRGSRNAADMEVDAMTLLRESTRGVDLDEELADLLKYQRSFEAASRAITTADELMSTVLNLKS